MCICVGSENVLTEGLEFASNCILSFKVLSKQGHITFNGRWNDGRINLLVLICEYIICEIKFLDFQFANIFLQKYILLRYYWLNKWQGLMYSKTCRKFYLILRFLTRYFYTIGRNNVSEQRLSHYMIKSTLNWLDLISIKKKTWQTATIDKGNDTSSVVNSLLKIKSKANWKCLWSSLKYVASTYCLGIGNFSWFYFDSFKLLKWQKKPRRQKSADLIKRICFSRRQSRPYLPNAYVS